MAPVSSPTLLVALKVRETRPDESSHYKLGHAVPDAGEGNANVTNSAKVRRLAEIVLSPDGEFLIGGVEGDPLHV